MVCPSGKGDQGEWASYWQRPGRCAESRVDELVYHGGDKELCIQLKKGIKKSRASYGQRPGRCAQSRNDELVLGRREMVCTIGKGIRRSG